MLPGEEISAQALLETLAGHKDKSLIFNYEGRDVRPSYHVTEVKTGSFRALDRGANAEHWNETFIQLWDIEVPTAAAIRRYGNSSPSSERSAKPVGFDADAKLTFEVSDGVKPMQIYRAERIETTRTPCGYICRPGPSSCKPRDRWLAAARAVKAAETASCAPKAQKPCCLVDDGTCGAGRATEFNQNPS